METTELLTVDEVAARVKCHPQTVRRWIWSGKLGHVKVGGLVRVPAEEVRRLIERGEQAAERHSHEAGVAALRATMNNLRTRVTSDDLDELMRKIAEGEQPADWESPVD